VIPGYLSDAGRPQTPNKMTFLCLVEDRLHVTFLPAAHRLKEDDGGSSVRVQVQWLLTLSCSSLFISFLLGMCVFSSLPGLNVSSHPFFVLQIGSSSSLLLKPFAEGSSGWVVNGMTGWHSGGLWGK
jgi:hypothetical protein